jgi:hypothetical protein
MAYSLDGLAALALAAGRPTAAARALGAGRAARERAGHPASAAFQPLLDDVSARVRTALGVLPAEVGAPRGEREILM